MFKSMALCAILLGGGISSLSAVTFNVDKPSFNQKGKYIESIEVYTAEGSLIGTEELIQTFNLQHAGEDQWSFPHSLSGLFEEVKHDLPLHSDDSIIFKGKISNQRLPIVCMPSFKINKETPVNSLDNKKIVTFSYPVGSNKPTCIITDRQ